MMTADSHPVISTTLPLWQDQPSYRPRAPLTEDVRADVCVIGGGWGGLSAAWHCADRGLDVVLLEAETVAGGASGSSGGFLIAGAAPFYHDTIARWGHDRAARIHAATLTGQAALVEVAEAAGARAAIRVGGLLRLAIDAAEADDVRAHHAALASDGFPGELVDTDQLPPAVRRPGRAALLTPHDGAMDPVAVVRAIASALERRGRVRIFEGTPARMPIEGTAVRTPAGRVLADRVVVAADGALAELVPAARAVRPRRLQACATAPLAPGHLPLPIYARGGLEYAQQTAEGRIVLGGFSDLDDADPPGGSYTARRVPTERVQARLARYLREELGVDAPVTHRWAGVVGYAEDPLPRCGRVPGTDGRVLALGGYNGTGNVQSFVAARIVSDIILDGDSADGDLYAALDA
jgi:glycine/D-amino acid oxidase-like deaminating enzyme